MILCAEGRAIKQQIWIIDCREHIIVILWQSPPISVGILRSKHIWFTLHAFRTSHVEKARGAVANHRAHWYRLAIIQQIHLLRNHWRALLLSKELHQKGKLVLAPIKVSRVGKHVIFPSGGVVDSDHGGGATGIIANALMAVPVIEHHAAVRSRTGQRCVAAPDAFRADVIPCIRAEQQLDHSLGAIFVAALSPRVVLAVSAAGIMRGCLRLIAGIASVAARVLGSTGK